MNNKNIKYKKKYKKIEKEKLEILYYFLFYF